jgi:hypothetical protein
MAGKQENPERPESPEPAPATTAQTLGEALADMGFVPMDPPKRFRIRPSPPENPLKRWRKPQERD